MRLLVLHSELAAVPFHVHLHGWGLGNQAMVLLEWSLTGRGKCLLSSVGAPAMVILLSALMDSDRLWDLLGGLCPREEFGVLWTEVTSYIWQIVCSYLTAPAIERRQKAEGELRGPSEHRAESRTAPPELAKSCD